MVAKDSLSLIERFLLAKNDQQNTFSDRRNSEKIEVHIYLAYISLSSVIMVINGSYQRIKLKLKLTI